MSEAPSITQARAERIARAHRCPGCGEYSYKRVKVKPSSAAMREEFAEVWHAALECGVCGAHVEMGIDADGDVVYAS